MTSHVRVTSETVPVSNLKEHPANPRRGDVDAIAASLEAHGQYRPIVAQRSTGYILAGNHTWKAARRLGWQHIAVTWIDADDQTAAQVLVADNRTSDLAAYDDAALAALLRDLPDLDGTGFDIHDLDRLEGVFDRPFSASDPSDPEQAPAPKPDRAPIRVGPYGIRMDESTFAEWWDGLYANVKKKQVVSDLRERLGLLPPTRSEIRAAERPTEGVETVAIDTVTPYTRNARQGDVGAISESLRHLGQYRPIVANRRDSQILVGNHTWLAARALGWTEIAVAWVDVDETEAAKIVAVDNRTSDLATYDDDLLGSLLVSLPTIDGTGFSPADLDDLLQSAASGSKYRRPATTSRVACNVGKFAWKVARDQWVDWENGLRPEIDAGEIHSWIAHTLTLPINTWTPED